MPSEFRTPLIVGGAVIGVCAVVAAAAVLTPEPAPTTTYETAEGESVTVSWEDYPAHAYTTPEDAVASPAESEVVERWSALTTALESRLGAWDLRFEPASEAGWYAQQGNGYGGASRLVTYNSQEQLAADVPPREDWPEVVSVVDEVLAEHGLSALVMDHEDPSSLGPDAWLLERFGSTDPEQWHTWSGTSAAHGEWFSLTLTDDELFAGDGDPEGDELRGPQWVSFAYGATTVPDDERAAFEREIEPFRGLEPPSATTSD